MKLALLSCMAAVLFLTPQALRTQTVGHWTPTDSMSTGRTGHRAIVLHNGDVLVCGGSFERQYLATCEVYRSDNGRWDHTATMRFARYLHTATLLDNGRVLVAGGLGNRGIDTICEVYDPLSGRWMETGWLNEPRHSHASTLLANGQVLVTGGLCGGKLLRSSEGYDPGAGEWMLGPAMKTPRASHSATLLPDGLVLVAGGTTIDGDSLVVTPRCEIFDPGSGIWRTTGSLAEARSNHAAVLLSDGRVMVVGGSAGKKGELESCEIYDPSTGSWSSTGSIAVERAGMATTLLPGGEVLAVGGYNSNSGRSYFATSEVYDPRTGSWRECAPISSPATTPTLSLLRDGRVLLAGGFNMNDYPRYVYRSGCELYAPPQSVLSTGEAAVAGQTASVEVSPNPASGEASIRYSLPSSTQTTITLVDGLGRQVAVVDEGMKSAGLHGVKFNTTERPAGAYYLHLNAGGIRRVIPIIIRH